MDLRESILNCDDLPKEKVTVPEWKQTVYVRSMTAKERDEYEMDLIANRDSGESQLLMARSKLVALCTVDEKGKRIFNWEDVEALAQKSSKAIGRISEAAQILNALSEKDIETASGN